jgi:hypothetical protein
MHPLSKSGSSPKVDTVPLIRSPRLRVLGVCRRHCAADLRETHRLPQQAVGLLANRCQLHGQTTRSPSAADCSRHAIYAGGTEFSEVRLQTSFNSAAARFHACALHSDVAAAFARNCCHPDQRRLARSGEVR